LEKDEMIGAAIQPLPFLKRKLGAIAGRAFSLLSEAEY